MSASNNCNEQKNPFRFLTTASASSKTFPRESFLRLCCATFVFCVVALLLVGCASTPKVVLPKVVSANPTPAEFLAAVNQNSSKVKSLYAANASVTAKDQIGAANGIVAYSDSGKFRLRGSVPMIGDVIDSGCDGSQLWFWGKYQDEKKLYSCQLNQYKGQYFSEIVPIDPMWFPDALAVFQIKQSDIVDEPRVQQDGTVAMTIKQTKGGETYRKRLIYESETAAIKRQDIQKEDGTVIVSIKYIENQLNEANGIVLPKSISLICGDRANEELVVNLGEITVNTDSAIPANAFTRPDSLQAEVVDLGKKAQQTAMVPPPTSSGSLTSTSNSANNAASNASNSANNSTNSAQNTQNAQSAQNKVAEDKEMTPVWGVPLVESQTISLANDNVVASNVQNQQTNAATVAPQQTNSSTSGNAVTLVSGAQGTGAVINAGATSSASSQTMNLIPIQGTTSLASNSNGTVSLEQTMAATTNVQTQPGIVQSADSTGQTFVPNTSNVPNSVAPSNEMLTDPFEQNASFGSAAPSNATSSDPFEQNASFGSAAPSTETLNDPYAQNSFADYTAPSTETLTDPFAQNASASSVAPQMNATYQPSNASNVSSGTNAAPATESYSTLSEFSDFPSF